MSDKLQILLSADFSTILHLCKTNPEFKETCKKNKNIIRDYILATHPETSENIDLLLKYTDTDDDTESDNYSLLIKTSDNKEIKLQSDLLESSKILKDMFVFATSTKNPKPISLPISEKILNYVINKMDPYQLNLDLDPLIEIAKAANYLEMEDYLDVITTRIAELIQNI